MEDIYVLFLFVNLKFIIIVFNLLVINYIVYVKLGSFWVVGVCIFK